MGGGGSVQPAGAGGLQLVILFVRACVTCLFSVEFILVYHIVLGAFLLLRCSRHFRCCMAVGYCVGAWL